MITHTINGKIRVLQRPDRRPTITVPSDANDKCSLNIIRNGCGQSVTLPRIVAEELIATRLFSYGD